MYSKELKKETLRQMLSGRDEELHAMRIAACALMNGQVIWAGAIGFSAYYRIVIRRVLAPMGTLPDTVEDVTLFRNGREMLEYIQEKHPEVTFSESTKNILTSMA